MGARVAARNSDLTDTGRLDEFLWSRHPDKTIDNLVAAHAAWQLR
jgi:hypothetical protein